MGRAAFCAEQEKKSNPFSEQLVCSWAETLLRGPTSGGSKRTPQRDWWIGDALRANPSLTWLCAATVPTTRTAARTHFYEEQQANLTRETQPRAPSWLRVHFKPETQSQFGFLNFPILVHVTVVEQDLAELVQVHPTNAGLQAKEKNVAQRENSSGFPQPCKAAGCAAAGKSTHGGVTKQPDPTSAHTRWGSEQRMGCKNRRGMGLWVTERKCNVIFVLSQGHQYLIRIKQKSAESCSIQIPALLDLCFPLVSSLKPATWGVMRHFCQQATISQASQQLKNTFSGSNKC